MGVVTARLDDQDEAVLRRAGINMSELLRRAAHEEARRLQRIDAVQRLAAARQVAPLARTRSEDLVRQDRDSH